MKNKLLSAGIILILPLLLAFAWVSPALAQEPDGDQVVFGDNLVLKAEEEIDGDVVVFGGNVTMPVASRIDGDLVVFGGNATVDGTVTGDIGMIGGNIKLGKTAVVEGDIGLLGGEADVAEGATVEGEVHSLNRFGFGEGEGFTIPPIPTAAPDAPAAPAPPVAPRFEHDSDFSDFGHGIFSFIKNVVEDIAVLLSLAVIGWLVAAFMPEQMKTVGDTFTRSAPFSFGVGLLTWFIAGAVGTILLITICLAFIPILGFILLAIATLFGWIVAGQVIGERLLLAGGRPYPNHVVSTLVGVTALTTVAIMPIIGEVPCIGGLLSFLGGLLGIVVALTGLGAVILTRFGTQPYPPDGYAFAGRPSPAPRPAPAAGPDWTSTNPLASLERAEADLRARIDAALAEADAATQETPAPPAVEPAGEEPSEATPPEVTPRPKRVRKPKPAETEPSPEAPSPEAPSPEGDEPVPPQEPRPEI